MDFKYLKALWIHQRLGLEIRFRHSRALEEEATDLLYKGEAM